MQCANCNNYMDKDDDYCQSGMNGTIFCSYACIQQAHYGNYAQSKISPILKRYPYLTSTKPF